MAALKFLSLILLFLSPSILAATTSKFNYSYSVAASGTQTISNFPGLTRAIYERNFALITPESRVYASLPGFQNVRAANVISPQSGAHFAMYFVDMAPKMQAYGSRSSDPNVERLVYVLKGFIKVEIPGGALKGVKVKKDFDLNNMGPGSYVYMPPSYSSSTKGGPKIVTVSDEDASFVVIDRVYQPVNVAEPSTAETCSETDADGDLSCDSFPTPDTVIGHEMEVQVESFPGEMFELRRLLPTDILYDFNIHIMDFQPGEYLNVKEVHYNQHGLLLLQGQGIYMLGERFFPVAAGDAIYMGPFVPQWYAALGKDTSRYFLYKDTNRDPLTVF